jgi:flagellar assembly protein FliH
VAVRKTAEGPDGFSAGIDAPAADGPAMNEAVLNDAMYKAKELREDATNKAMKIIADANAEAEAIREQAKQVGYDEGLKEGKMEAARRTDEYIANITRERDEIIAEERQKLEDELAREEEQLVDVSAKLIEKLTGILVDDYKPVMLHMINSAVSEEDSSKKFVIRVSEENYGYISDNKDRISGAANPNIEIELYGDAKLGGRQCIIETDNGIIDLSMDVQVKNLVTAMKLLSES